MSTSDNVDFATSKNVLKPGQSITVSGDSTQNIKYPGQFNFATNIINFTIPLNILFHPDVESISVSFSGNYANIFIDGGGFSTSDGTYTLAAFSYQTGMTINFTPNATIAHDANATCFVRVPTFTITAS